MAGDQDAGRLHDCISLRVTTARRGTTTMLALAGEWDLASVPVARRAIAAAFDDRPQCLVLALTGLRFIDSSALHATVAVARRAEADGVHLAIVTRSRHVRRAFEICGLSDGLPLLDTEPSSRSVRSRGRGVAGLGRLRFSTTARHSLSRRRCCRPGQATTLA